MDIYCDSNQKAGKHNNKEMYFIEQGYNIIRKRLKVGDYMLNLTDKISIDTKQDLNEVCCNLFNKEDNKRFIRECIRAKANHIKLVILVEEEVDKYNLPDITISNHKHKLKVKGNTIKEKMLYFEKMYGVRFMFCDKNNAGAHLIDILSKNRV